MIIFLLEHLVAKGGDVEIKRDPSVNEWLVCLEQS